MTELERLLASFQLVLATVPVVGQPPRGSAEELRRLQMLDPAAARQVADERARIR